MSSSKEIDAEGDFEEYKGEKEIMDKHGGVKLTFKNEYEAIHNIDGNLITEMSTFFNPKNYHWEKLKKTTEYTVAIGAKGSMLAPEIPAFMTKLHFYPIYSYDTIVQCLTDTSHILNWDKSIEKCDEIIKFTKNASVIHTVNKPSFLLEKREFIEK